MIDNRTQYNYIGKIIRVTDDTNCGVVELFSPVQKQFKLAVVGLETKGRDKMLLKVGMTVSGQGYILSDAVRAISVKEIKPK